MAVFLRRLAIGLIVAYLAALAVLFVMQRSLIFPAPQHRHAPASGFVEVMLKPADGLALQAHWRAPQPARAAVVYFHGNAGSLAGSAREAGLLAARGYGVLLVEYRGYGGNPGAPSETGFYADGRAAMAFLVAQDIAPARTIVIGNSIGSGTATQMAREYAPAALILTSPFTSLPDVAGEKLPFAPVNILLRDRFDNLAKVPTLKMPVLVQHGTHDNVVPFAQGKALANAAPMATLQRFEGLGHELSFQAEAQAGQIDWLAAEGL